MRPHRPFPRPHALATGVGDAVARGLLVVVFSVTAAIVTSGLVHTLMR